MNPMVLIPQNYDTLPPAQRKQVIPICIAANDQHGQPIAAAWFSQGVAPVRKQLIRIANYALGDPWCVSELAETAVHRLWARYGNAVGDRPDRRVLKKAMWVGEELKIGDWRKMKYPSLYLALDALEEKFREQTLADSNKYAERINQELMLDSVADRLKNSGNTAMLTVYQLIRRGYNWSEIAEKTGAPSVDAAKHRFYRWIKKAAS